MSFPATRPQAVSFNLQQKPEPKSVEYSNTESPLQSPPSSGYSTPTGLCTPTGYYTSAPSSPEGPSKPRKKGRSVHSSSREEVNVREMVEVGGSRVGKGKMVWRPRLEAPSQRTMPPWAEPDAQPPPPPTQMYAPISPPSTRRTMKPITPMSTATEANPTPTHFNRPAAGSSPLMVRRSLFRGNTPPRARSVDSLTHSVPWAEAKLRPTPRTDSPSRVAPWSDPPPSWAAPPSDPSSQRMSRRDVPPRGATSSSVSSQMGPSPSSQVGPSPSMSSQMGPSPDTSSQMGPSPDTSSQMGPSPDTSSQIGPSSDTSSQAGPSPSASSHKTPSSNTLPQVASTSEAPSRDQLTSESSFRSTAVSSFTREVEVRESMLMTAHHHSQAVMRPPHTPRDLSVTQCVTRDAPWRVPGEGGAPQAAGIGGQGASGGQAVPRPQPGSQLSGQPSVEVIHRPAGAPDAPSQSPSTMVTVKPDHESQPAPKQQPQEQTSPTPWRKNVASRVTGAKAAPTEQQIPPGCGTSGDASAASSAGDLGSAASAPSEGQAPKPAPWRRPAGPVQQEAPGPPSTATPAVPEPPKTVVKVQDKVKRKTGTQAGSAAQVADSHPNWRKQQPKKRPAATSGVTAAATAAPAAAPYTPPPASSTPLAATSQSPAAAVPDQGIVKPAASAPVVNTAPVGRPVTSAPSHTNKRALTAADQATTPAPAADKLASPALSTDKLVSHVPVVVNKPVPAAVNKPVPAVVNKPVPAAADKPANKSASPVPANKSTPAPVPEPTTSVAPVSVSSKSPSPAQTSSVSASVAGVPASITTSATQGAAVATSAPGVLQVTLTTKTPSVSAAEPKVGADTEARWATSPPLAPLLTTAQSPTPSVPPRQSAGEIVSAPTVPQPPRPAPTPQLSPPTAVTTQLTAAAEPTSSKISPAITTESVTQSVAVTAPISGAASGPGAPGADPAKVLAAAVTTGSPTMPIPMPPPAPDAKLLKSDGTTSVPLETTGTSKSGPFADSKDATVSGQPEPSLDPALVMKPTEAVKPPYPEFPPPPPVEDVGVPPGSSECEPGFPPPPSLLQEERIAPPLAFTTQLKELTEEEEVDDFPSPEYVRESVTKRIKAFEKQASKEEEPTPAEWCMSPARPVAPWVKRTSSGPVQQQNYWDMTSPEEPDVCWSSPPQKEVERTKSPSRPAPAREPPKAPIIPAPPVAPPAKVTPPVASLGSKVSPPAASPGSKVSPPAASPGSKVTPLPATTAGRVAPPRPRHLLPRQRSASTGDYQAQYITPDEPSRLFKMPADGTSAETSVDAVLPPTSEKDDVLTDPWCEPKNPRVITFQDVSAAAFKIKSGIMNTPCTRSHMSSFTDMEIFFKKEFNQYTGSFKERGARYTLLMLSKEQQKKGVIAASAGNHALALSYHGQDLGIPITVVMPLVAPIMKVQACRQYGANVIVKGKDIGECRVYALRMAKEQGLLYVNGYDHPHILAGQGTLGLEIVEQVPNIDAVVIPVGGAGLIAGVALAVKALYPHVQVIGVESEQCSSFTAAMKAGRPVYVKAESTLADGLAVPMVGVNAFATASNLVDKVVTVREEWIAISILRLVECEKAVVEGAGATALAAILAGELPELKGKRVVIPLCGGNIDTTVLGRCLERGLAADGRLVKFTVTVSDRPGGIAELTRLLANLGVSIKDMVHERAWIRSDIFSVEVKVMAETKDYDHFLELKSALEVRYEKVRFAMPDQIHQDTTL